MTKIERMSSATRSSFSSSVALIAWLTISSLCLAPSLAAVEHTSVKKSVTINAPVPEKRSLRLISYEPLTEDREVIGIIVLYDDAATKRPVDYAELYNTEGNLLAVHWFDRFGIERTAVDRGIIRQDGDIEGTLVLLVDGDFI
jgi:hypothetical protein